MKTAADYTAAQELTLYAVNDSETYFKSLSPIMDNMDNKRQRGTFDAEKAVKGLSIAQSSPPAAM